jgi:hypothetical protein
VKRAMVMISTLCLVATGLCACGQVSDGGPKAKAGDNMLRLLPQAAQGVFFMDVKKAVATPVAKNLLEDENGDLQEFTEKTGIDPSRDINLLAAAITGETTGDDSEGVMVLNLKYDRDRLLSKLQEKNEDVEVESYQGVDIVALPDTSDDDPTHAAFLDGDHLALGTPSVVRAVIDVKQKRAKSVQKNAELMGSLESIDRAAIFWGAYLVSEETAQQIAQGNPMLANMSGVRSVVMSVDYQESILLGEVVARGENEEQNQQIVDLLNGVKAFAAMGAQDNPELGELLRQIEVTKGPDNVRISASIPEELLLRMQEEEVD